MGGGAHLGRGGHLRPRRRQACDRPTAARTSPAGCPPASPRWAACRSPASWRREGGSRRCGGLPQLSTPTRPQQLTPTHPQSQALQPSLSAPPSPGSERPGGKSRPLSLPAPPPGPLVGALRRPSAWWDWLGGPSLRRTLRRARAWEAEEAVLPKPSERTVRARVWM